MFRQKCLKPQKGEYCPRTSKKIGQSKGSPQWRREVGYLGDGKAAGKEMRRGAMGRAVGL